MGGRLRVLALGVVLLGSLAQAAAAGDRGDLQELRQKSERARAAVVRSAEAERGLLAALEGLDRSLVAIDVEHRATRVRARESEAQYTQLDRERSRQRERLEATRSTMTRRVVALYRLGETASLRVLFASRDPFEWLSRASALRVLIAADRHLIERYRKGSRALEAARERSAAARVRRDREQAAALAQRRVLAGERAEKTALLTRVQGDGAKHRSLLAELEATARALEAKLARFETRGRRSRSGGFAARRGRLPAPLVAPIVKPFGRVVDPRFGTETFRRGVEFGADRGSAVHAVASGEVRFADWFRGYGRMLILDHGEGYFSLYAQLERFEVAVGDEVEVGERIGAVGDTGSLTGPGLYFELRRGPRPLDPKQWLARAR
jgi:septal ring factor EnvC (AmiA/AmiB activator)